MAASEEAAVVDGAAVLLPEHPLKREPTISAAIAVRPGFFHHSYPRFLFVVSLVMRRFVVFRLLRHELDLWISVLQD